LVCHSIQFVVAISAGIGTKPYCCSPFFGLLVKSMTFLINILYCRRGFWKCIRLFLPPRHSVFLHVRVESRRRKWPSRLPSESRRHTGC